VETVISAISPGTELKVYNGEFHTEEDNEKNSVFSDVFQYPLQYGYSLVGRIVALGNSVKQAQIGQLVFAFHHHEESFNIPFNQVKLVPEGISPEDAVFLPNVETAINFVHDGRPMLGEKISVFGQGIIGLLTTYLLSQVPFTQIYTFDILEKRRLLSKELGAKDSFDPIKTDVAGVIPNGADLSYELSGSSSALGQAIKATGYNGRVVIGSWYGSNQLSLSLGNSFHRSHMNIIASQVSQIRPELMGRWTKERRFEVVWEVIRKLKPSRFITHSVKLSNAPEVYSMLDQNPKDVIQVVFNY